MNPIRKLRYAWYTSFAKTRNDNRDLRARVQEQMQALWNRNELIALQDETITELRGENRTLQQDITMLRNALDECARLREHYQNKAAQQ